MINLKLKEIMSDKEILSKFCWLIYC
jgi:hypothetical protein